MNVLFIYTGIKEAGPLFTIGMAKGFQANSIKTYAILSGQIENRKEWETSFESNQIAFIDHFPKKRNVIITSLKFLKECIKINRQFSGVRFDFVIRTFIGKYDNILTNLVSHNRVVNVCHDPIPHSSMDKKAAHRYEERIRKSDEVIVLTKAFIPVITKKYGISTENIHYMRHGLMEHGSRRQTKNELINGPIRFLFFGRIDGYKGLHILAKAYHELHEKYDNCSLIIAGSGNFAEYKDEFIDESVTILNRYIQDDEVEELFTAGNVIAVLPYIDATQSGVIPIAYAYGIPVIASDTGGLKEQLFDGEMGILFDNGNAEDLRKKMESFFIDKDLYNTQAHRMESARNRLEWKSVTNELLDSLKDR